MFWFSFRNNEGTKKSQRKSAVYQKWNADDADLYDLLRFLICGLSAKSVSSAFYYSYWGDFPRLFIQNQGFLIEKYDAFALSGLWFGTRKERHSFINDIEY